MNIPEVVRGQEQILHLWEHASRSLQVTSWTIFVDLWAFQKLYQDELRQYAGERHLDPETVSIEFMRYKSQFKEDQFGLSSDYFNATVLEATYPNDKVSKDKPDKTRYAPITKEDFLKLGIGRAFPIPVLGVESITGLDGTSYGLQMGDSWGSLHIRWWGSGPSEWYDLTKWATDTMQFLKGIIDQHNKIDGTEST